MIELGPVPPIELCVDSLVFNSVCISGALDVKPSLPAIPAGEALCIGRIY